MDYDLDITEDNFASVTQRSGSVRGPTNDFMVLGVARAGTSFSGAGSAISGTYGSLLINGDGSYVYSLDNEDIDTNLLTTGQFAEDRFTYTFSSGGVISTERLVIRVNGSDELDQVSHHQSSSLHVKSSFSIDLMEHHMFSSTSAVTVDTTYAPLSTVTNEGTISVGSSSANEAYGIEVYRGWGNVIGAAEIVNRGLIEAITGVMGVGSATISAMYTPLIVNHGVLRAVTTANPDGQGMGVRAVGVASYHHGEEIINTGTIEALSSYGEAIGIFNRGLNAHINNSGMIFVSGGSSMDPLGIAGVRSGQSSGYLIENSGTIHVTSYDELQQTVGISLFPDSGSINSIATIDNSGTIVADIAVAALASPYVISVHVRNSGIIEGGLVLDEGYNLIVNEAGAVWRGNYDLGWHDDLVTNFGVLDGDIDFGDGADFFDSSSGVFVGHARGGMGNDLLRGGAQAEILSGENGSDLIEGGGGADVLTGGAGADIFVYRATADSTIDEPDLIADFQSGIDKLDFSSLTPGSISVSVVGAETLVTFQSPAQRLEIRVAGTIASDDIILSRTDDDLIGTSISDILYAHRTSVGLFGLDGVDTLIGSAGDDVLDGGTGDDSLRGDAGHDLYIFDSAFDHAVELMNEGIDTIQSSVSAELNPNIENLILTGSISNYAVGNSLANEITGNVAGNFLDGRAGGDRLIGGGGDDIYRVDDIADVVVEQDAGGIDTVESLISYTLPHGVENLILIHQSHPNGIGNDLDNVIDGNFSANRLDGGAGADILRGDYGNDTYVVDNAGDSVVEYLERGSDTVISSISFSLTSNLENLTLTGAASIDGAGNEFANILIGNAASNILTGGGGDDFLEGGTGNDRIDGGTGKDSALFEGLFRGSTINLSHGAGTVSHAVNGDSDTLNDLEYVCFNDGLLDFDEDGLGAQIARLYDTVLQRAPDAIGLDYWIDLIQDHGASLETVGHTFLESAEFQAVTGQLTNAQFVDYVYEHALGRAPDDAGKSYYIGQLEGGLSRANLLMDFSESQEHRLLTSELISDGFFTTDDTYQAVFLLYDSFAGRLPDSDGIIYYSEAIKSGSMTLDDVAAEFAGSFEFSNITGGMSTDEIVDFMYTNSLNRQADASGKAFYVDQLENGNMTVAGLLLDFSQSIEHYGLEGSSIVNGVEFLG